MLHRSFSLCIQAAIVLSFRTENVQAITERNMTIPFKEGSEVQPNVVQDDLPHSTMLDAENKYLLMWDFSNNSITFQVAVQTPGYVGLGFSPNGGMPGSDIVIAWVDDLTEQVFLSDRYADARAEPKPDINQNYELIHGYQNETHTVIRFRRPLILCEDDDWSIRPDTVRVIWSYSHEDPDVDGHAVYHGINRGVKSMVLLNHVRETPRLPTNIHTMDLLHQSATIPAKDTWYLCRSFRFPKFDRKHHLIVIEPIIQKGHESFVHHMTVYGCFQNVSDESIEVEHECFHRDMPLDWWNCNAVLQGWSIGGGTISFPEHVGYPFGTDEDPSLLLLETHYDNPQERADIVDSSGLRFILTPELRKYDAGHLVLGTIPRPMQIIPPYETDFITVTHCTEQCYKQAMKGAAEEIKIIGVLPHTHLTGRAYQLRHFRQGIELEPIAEDMHYDFNLQEMRMKREETTIRPGDHTILECHYNSSKRTNLTVGGLRSSEEMCTGFVLYYPKIPLSLCFSFPRLSFIGKFGGLTVLDNGFILAPKEYANKNMLTMLHQLVDWKNETIRKGFQMLLKMEEPDSYMSICQDGPIVYQGHQRPFTPAKILLPLPRRMNADCTVSRATTVCMNRGLFIILSAKLLVLIANGLQS